MAIPKTTFLPPGTVVRFTDEHLSALLAQARPFEGAEAELRALQEEGMNVDGVLPSGRVNVSYRNSQGGRSYRTYSRRDLDLS